MDIKPFLDYLQKNKRASDNTVVAYSRDIRAFERYLDANGSVIETATQTDILSYIMDCNKRGESKATTNRRIASLRALYRFLYKKNIVKSDPTEGLKTPRVERTELDFLQLDEVEKLLSAPDESIKGKRDKAILEVLYGTGLRVMELIELNYGDLNIRMGYIQCSSQHGRPRIVPIGSYARVAITEYLRDSRPALLRDEENKESPDRPLFLNYVGERLTRQGVWKILNEYAEKVELKGKITPHKLRTSFAVHMIENGADLKTLQELLGYDDMQAMQVYTQINRKRIKDVYDKTHPRA